MLADVLPLTDETSCQSYVVAQGIENGMKIPLHLVDLCSSIVSGRVRVGVCDQLPVKSISIILGNDLVGGKVTPLFEVTPHEISEFTGKTFPACAITRAKANLISDVVDLSDSFCKWYGFLYIISFNIYLIDKNES